MRLTSRRAKILAGWLDNRRAQLDPEWELARILGEMAATLRSGETISVEDEVPRLLAYLRGEAEEP